ncbi:MAG: MmgE/PrpD family protein [Chloroflexi bacterium]|nr:MmgE/PrpD family protein [Chloroflexota bacterium]
MNETRDLARFTSELDYDHIPPQAIQAAKGYILDCLGCGLAAPGLLWSRMVAELAQESGASGPCVVLGLPWRTSAPYATLVNGTMIGGFETDHVYSPASCHPGASVFPALLAVAEREHLSGRHFLTALVAGYEAVCRIGQAATRAVEDVAGFHGPATNGPFGAATAVARALGLDPEQTASALGIAGSNAGGLLEFSLDGSMIKRLHMGRASQMGLESALLAQKGFTGPHTILEGKRGFLKVFSPDPHPERLLEGLGKNYVMASVLQIKSYPCHIRAHPFVDALVQFKAKHPIDPRHIQKIQIFLNPHDVDRHGQQEPGTLLAAQYSIPYSVAVALWRDLSDPRAFSDGVESQEDIRKTAREIELHPLQDSSESKGQSLVLDIDGESHYLDASDYKGSPTNPYNFDDLCEKFRRYAAVSVEQSAIASIIEMVSTLEDVPDITVLTRLLAPSPA